MSSQFNPPRRILMGPGPSDTHPRVLAAMSRPLIGHLDPEFIKIMDEVKQMVRETFITKNELTFVVSGPASAGMETCLVNLLEPDDECIICVNGIFGGRMADIAERCGAKVYKVECEWGKIAEPGQIKMALEHCPRPKLVSLVHGETSTGALQPLQEIGDMVHNAGGLYMVDAVTTYCGLPIKVDEWKIDVAYGGSQKCLSAPPGLSPVTFSEAAVKIIENRKQRAQSWFLDLSLLRKYWEGATRVYHHTAPVSAFFAFYEALKLVLEEGLEQRWARHNEVHQYLRKKLESLGFRYLVDERHRLPVLNTVFLPGGREEVKIRTDLLNKYNIEVGAGHPVFGGKLLRIGLMGESCTKNNVNVLVAALEELIR